MENQQISFISSEVLTLEEIRIDSSMRLMTVLSVMSTEESALKWCALWRLIKNTMLCTICRKRCTLQKDNQEIDGYKWVCTTCEFHRDRPQHQFSYEARVAKNIAAEWSAFMREECTKWLNNQDPIGGTTVNGEAEVVEIGEFKSVNHKYNCDTSEEGHWILGGIDRASKHCFLTKVPNRHRKTLKACISQHILPGTHIISDKWASYADIEKIDQGIYQHSIITHKRSFVDVNDSFIHTQNIKNLWMRLKMFLEKRPKVCDELFMSYLNEFTYRNNCRSEDIFTNFIIMLSQK